MSARSFFAIGACVLASCASSSAAPRETMARDHDTYALRVLRESRVGERFHVVAEGSRRVSTRLTSGEAVIESDESAATFRLIASMRVDAVGSGQSTHETWTVESFVSDGGNVLLAPGTVFRVNRTSDDAREAFTVGDAPTEDAVADALSVLLDPPVLVGADAWLASSAPQPIGGTLAWPIDDIARALSTNPDLMLTADRASGHLTLDRLDTVTDEPCVVVKGHADVDDVPLIELPAEAHVDRSAARLDLESWLPLDAARPWPRDRTAFVVEMQARVEVPDGEGSLVFHFETARDVRREAITR